MVQTQLPSRPTTTDDLVQRLRRGTDPEESRALQELAKEMAKIFRDERRTSHVAEAAALASAATASGYQDLSRAFGNMIIHGTADGNILEPQLLVAFVSVLRCAGGDKTADVELGRTTKSLQTRLKAAVDQADPRSQYRLIRTSSSVLDALIDTKTAGLSREELHEPLLKQLESLSEERELRLAQAACYAHQALLGIPNDEGPYKALWRNMQPVIESVTKVAASVPTMDPAKLFDGLTQLAHLPALVRSMVDVVKDLSGLISSLEGAAEAVKLRQKQKSWYVALRFTEMLLSARAFGHLNEFVAKVPCRSEKEFLCGLYAQLELALKSETQDTEEHEHPIVRLLNQVLVPLGCSSRHPRVYEWIKLLADTLGQDHWESRLLPARGFRWRPWKAEYTDSIRFQQPSKVVLPADLLNAAWGSCLGAQVFYADVQVRKHYLENDERILKIERLSGDRVPMEYCYINLSVVEQAAPNAGHSKETCLEPKSSPFSLLARLKVEAPAEDKQISLETLFDARRRQDVVIAPPQRILIRGQAGVGKTTLCKRILYNYLREGMWAGMFERLLWVPLRTLKTASAENCEQWLRQRYFRVGRDGEIFAKALAQIIGDPAQRGKTLLILDGLDEVSRELDSENPGLLTDLLKHPDIIVTSRPSGLSLTHLGRVDLELETIGFDHRQVKAYMKMAAGEQAAEIETFLQNHWLLQGLARIPIQLEALCYSWDSSMYENGLHTTMTSLYRRIESKLWKKDAARLEKPHEGKPLAEDTAKRMLDSDIAWKVALEHSLLRYLAFTGLYNDVVEFDQTCQNKILDHWGRRLHGSQVVDGRPSSLSLAKISFLRSSDRPSDQKNRSYHFLHLTFQEFFAAQYFVEQWSSGRQLDVPNLGPGSPESEPTETEAFLRKGKYKARYNVFWRFVAGLLYEKRDDGQLCRFFHTVENEPRDLLGPTHQRLVMHCLHEVPSDTSAGFAHLRTALEDLMTQWLLFEYRLHQRTSLASEMELPERVLEAASREGSVKTKVAIMSALRKVSPKTTELALRWLNDDDFYSNLHIAALKMPQPRKGLPLKTLLKIINQLPHYKNHIQKSIAADAIKRHAVLPPAALEAIISRLEDEDAGVRGLALSVLRERADLPTVAVQAIFNRLADEDRYVSSVAIEVASSLATLSPSTVSALVGLLEQKDQRVQNAALSALGRQVDLLPAAVQAIIGRLEDENSFIRTEAVVALGRQANRSPAAVQAILSRLDDEDGYVRHEAAKTLGTQVKLSPAALQAVIGRLEDEDSIVREGAAEALGRQATLSPTAVQAILGRLEDEAWRVRREATDALGKHADLSSVAIQAIIGLFTDENHYIRQAAVEALGNQSGLSPEAVQAIVGRLEDEDWRVRIKAAEALGGKAVLPPAGIQAIVNHLDAEDVWFRRPAVKTLQAHTESSLIAVKAMQRMTEDGDPYVRVVALKALGSQATLMPAALQAMLGRLDDENQYVRRVAATSLEGRADLSLDILIQNAESFYKVWLERSFDEHSSLYVEGEVFMDMPAGLRVVRSDQVAQFRDAIRGAGKRLGIPQPQEYGKAIKVDFGR